MRAEDLKGWLAAAKRDRTEREKRVKDGGAREYGKGRGTGDYKLQSFPTGTKTL